MAQFFSVRLEDGTEVLFENADQELVHPRSGGADIAEVDPRLSRLESIAQQAGALCTALRRHMAPDEIALEIGARLSGEVGWFIAKSSAEASVKITVTWKTDPADKPIVPAA